MASAPSLAQVLRSVIIQAPIAYCNTHLDDARLLQYELPLLVLLAGLVRLEVRPPQVGVTHDAVDVGNAVQPRDQEPVLLSDLGVVGGGRLCVVCKATTQ